MDRVLLDGTEYSAEGFDALKLTFGLNEENKTYDYTTGEGLVFEKGFGGFEYLQEVFYGPKCDGHRRQVAVRLYIGCCSTWYEFTATSEGVLLCETDCTVTLDLQRITKATRAYRYLRDTIFWKNGFVDAYQHPRIYYASQPGFLQYVALLQFSFLIPLVILLQAWAKALKFLCKAASLGFGKCDLGRIEDLSVCSIYEFIGGTGRQSPSPLVREILEYQCAQAGIGFSSSIFQTEPYANLALFQLQYEAGSRDGSVNWIAENAANLTPLQLLDQLAPIFQLDYRIINGSLVVERKDYFTHIGQPLGEVRGCIRILENAGYAYGDFQYSDDPSDAQGNRLRSVYDDVIEYNPEGVEWKTGKQVVSARFGRARFMFDHRGFDRPDDVPGGDSETFLGDNFIDRFRATDSLNFFGCRDDRREHDLILSNDRATYLKLLVLQPGFDRRDAHTIRRVIGNRNGLTFYAYNYPMYFAEGEEAGLYRKFQIVEHPDEDYQPRYGMDDAEVPWSCATVAAIKASEDGYLVTTSRGVGQAETVEVDIEKQVITAKNITVSCLK